MATYVINVSGRPVDLETRDVGPSLRAFAFETAADGLQAGELHLIGGVWRVNDAKASMSLDEETIRQIEVAANGSPRAKPGAPTTVTKTYGVKPPKG